MEGYRMINALSDSKPNEILQRLSVVTESGKENCCVIFQVADFAPMETRYTLKDMWSYPDLRYYLYVIFGKTQRICDLDKDGKQIVYYPNTPYRNKLVYSILRGYLKFEDEIMSFSPDDVMAGYDLFERSYVTDSFINNAYSIKETDNFAEASHSVTNVLNKLVDKPVFSVMRQDYRTAKRKKMTESLELLCNIKPSLYKKYKNRDYIWHLYPELKDIVYAWIDNKLSAEDIDRLYMNDFFHLPEQIENKKLVDDSSSTIIHKKDDFFVIHRNDTFSISDNAIYDYGFIKKEEDYIENGNLCVMTKDKIGAWCLDRVEGKDTTDIEKNMDFHIFADRFDRDLASFFESKHLRYIPNNLFYNYFVASNDLNKPIDKDFWGANVTSIPSFLLERYRRTGFILEYPNAVIKKLCVEYVKRKLMGFYGIDKYSCEFDTKTYSIKEIKTVYHSKESEEYQERIYK